MGCLYSIINTQMLYPPMVRQQRKKVGTTLRLGPRKGGSPRPGNGAHFFAMVRHAQSAWAPLVSIRFRNRLQAVIGARGMRGKERSVAVAAAASNLGATLQESATPEMRDFFTKCKYVAITDKRKVLGLLTRRDIAHPSGQRIVVVLDSAKLLAKEYRLSY